MAKLATTVNLTDENGAEHTFGPNDKDALPDWAEKQLAASWPADRDDLWAEAPSKTKVAAAEKAAEGDKK